MTQKRPAEYVQGWEELIRSYRVYLGVSQRTLCERLGMSERSLSDIEVGRRQCPPGFLDSVLKIVEDFDTAVEKIIELADENREGDQMYEVNVSSDPTQEWMRAIVGRAAVESGTIMPILVG